jgi:hypothetical protein
MHIFLPVLAASQPAITALAGSTIMVAFRGPGADRRRGAPDFLMAVVARRLLRQSYTRHLFRRSGGQADACTALQHAARQARHEECTRGSQLRHQYAAPRCD